MFKRALRSGQVAGLLMLATICGCGDERTPLEPRIGPPAAAAGDVFTVTNTNNDGAGSLRATVAAATVGSTIRFDPSLAGQTINLLSEIVLSADQIIEAPVAGGIRISGGGLVRVFAVQNSAVTLRNVAIVNGFAQFGGGIVLGGGSLRLENSTVSGNGTTQFGGGGIYADGSVTLVNSTVSSNSSTAGGGGFSVRSNAIVTLINSTVAGNTSGTTSGAAEILNTGRLVLRNSIVANNTATTGSNCDEPSKVILEGRNISNDNSCGTGDGMLVADPLLGSLANNGGPTRTHALLAGSPAVDAALSCIVNQDQRYVTRPKGAGCDIGAFEFDDYITVALTVDNSISVNPNTGVAVLTGTLKCSAPVSLPLKYDLSQPLKGRVPASVTASVTAALDCTTSNQYWSAALAPISGAFQSGSASASAQTVTPPPFRVIPTSVAKTVKLFWGHK